MSVTIEELKREFKEEILSHPEESAEAAKDIFDYLHHSTVCYHGRCVYTLLVPKVFSPEMVRIFESAVSTAYSIFDKIIRAYQADPAYRKLFGFPAQIEEWALYDRGYDCTLPIARFDIFFDEDTLDFKFCEINTDGTSAMNEDYVLDQAFALNPVHCRLRKKYSFRNWELYDSWVQAFADIYHTYPGRKKDPFIAIVDFLETGSITEFEEFQRRFEKAGYRCGVCEITKLVYTNGELYSENGEKIDVIYRRAVTRDVFDHQDEVRDFLLAVKDSAVCLIGSFATQVIHNKWLFKLIREKETLSLLSKEEQEFVLHHFPYTALLADGHCDRNELIEDKDKWLVKPMDSYASRGVYAGCDQTKAEWIRILDSVWGRDYIVQEYCTPYRTENISDLGRDTEFRPFTNMSGLFVYNGRFAGVYTRHSDAGIISSQYNERSVPSYYLEETGM